MQQPRHVSTPSLRRQPLISDPGIISSCTGVVLNNNYCYSKNNVYLKENFNKNSASVLALKGTCAGQYATGTVPDEMNKACCWS